jgi:uncharacterized repeat protein (TIGR01451 family)
MLSRSHPSCTKSSSLAGDPAFSDGTSDFLRKFLRQVSRSDRFFRGVTVSALICGAVTASAQGNRPPLQGAPPAAPVSAVQLFAMPMQFEPNAGQAGDAVKFLSRGPSYTLSLTPTEAILSLRSSNGHKRPMGKPTAEERADREGRKRPHETKITHVELRMTLLGANAQAEIEGMEALGGTVNYFIGNDPARWRTGIPTFGKVKYRQVYPGVDLVYYGNQRQVEYDFIVATNADPGRIAFGFSGEERLEIEDEGGLVAHVSGGTVRWHQPVAYQETGAGRQQVSARFALRGGHQVGFQLGAYDPGKPLIIDPVLVYSTYLGGGGDEYAGGIAVDANGNVYVVGDTSSINFPTGSAYDSTPNGSNDVFVTKLNASGSNIVYSTYLGGGGDEFAGSIAVDSSGNAYVTGVTDSQNYPAVNAAFSANAGFQDVFITKIGPTGATLGYSTYLGGDGDDIGNAIAVDSGGNAYVTGQTYSLGTGSGPFPTMPNNAYQTHNNGLADAFVAKFSSSGALVYSTFLGGSSSEKAIAITVDGSGNAYVAGEVRDDDAVPPAFPASDFPTLNAYQSTFNPGATDPYTAGNSDGFVTKLNAAGTGLIFSTFLGGGGDDAVSGIAIDPSQRVYVTGETSSTNFPTLNGAQPAINNPDNSEFPSPDMFVTAFQNTGSTVLYSTYLGGSDFEYLAFFYRFGIAVDAFGYIYVAGYTTSFDFPGTVGADRTNYYVPNDPGDGFVAKINPAVPGPASLVYSTLFGGIGDDRATAIAVDTNGNFYVTGITTSTNFFPVTPGAFRQTNGGGFYDSFIAKFASPRDISVTMTPSLDPVTVGSNVTYTILVNNNGRATFNNVTNFIQLATNFQILSVTTSKGTTNATTNAGQVIFNIGTLSNNAGVIQTVVAKSTSPAFTSNSATLTSTETPTLEPNTGNNLSTVFSTIRGIADLQITNLTGAPSPVFVGSNLTYTIGIRNKGPWPATSTMLTCNFSTNVAIVSATNSSGFCTTGTGLVTCSFTNMTNGAVAMVTINATPTQPGAITNAASLTSFEIDTAPANNSSNLVIAAVGFTDLTLGLTAAPDPVLAGSNLNYTVRVTNLGPFTATNVVVTDVLPPGAIYVTTTNAFGTTSQTNGIVTCNLGNVATNSVPAVTIVIRPTIAGPTTNTASVIAGTPDLNLNNNSASVVSTVNPAVDLALFKTATPASTFASSNVTYTILVTNKGPLTATGVILTDTIPAAFVPLSVQITGGTCVLSNGVVTCNVGILPATATVTATIIAMTTTNGVFTNTASVTVNEPDTVASNNTASATVRVTQLAIAMVGTNVVLSWNTNDPAIILQSRTNFTTNLWINATPPGPFVVSNRFTVTNSATGTNRIYRLFR